MVILKEEERLINLSEVIVKTGLSKSMIYKLISKGKFPRPKKNGRKSSWVLSDIINFIYDGTIYGEF